MRCWLKAAYLQSVNRLCLWLYRWLLCKSTYLNRPNWVQCLRHNLAMTECLLEDSSCSFRDTTPLTISPSLKNISPNWNSNLYLNIMWLTQNISSVIHLNYFTHFKLSTHLNCNLWFALEFLGKIRIWYCNNINFSLVLLLGLQWLLVVCLNNVVSVFCRGYM